MTGLLSAAWAGPARPFVSATPGDLEWWTAQGGPDADWPGRIRIWEIDGHAVGWCWFKPPAEADSFVAPDLSIHDATHVRDEMLEWHRLQALRAARDRSLAGTDDGEGEPPALELWAADGWPDAAFLADRSWSPGEVMLTQYHQALDVELDPPRVPDGYRIRTLTGPDDIPARVEVHRAAFAPSKLTLEKYETLVRQDHYRFDRDLVIEAPDGSFAAFAMCWVDSVGSIGEFEPVGVHPDHQRRGLGNVVMRAGLRLMRAAGVRDAIVFSLRSNAASEALYRSAGFRELAVHRRYTKPIA
jgi:ribosomal protein S18 acetylase RimI-like enzyme